jgi:hypothetical protein
MKTTMKLGRGKRESTPEKGIQETWIVLLMDDL